MNKCKFYFKGILSVGILLLMTSISLRAQIVTTPKLEWANNLTSNNSYINSVAVGRDALGGVISVGTFTEGTADFDPGTGIHNMTYASFISAVYIMKYTEEGMFQWAKQIVIDTFSDLSGYQLNVSSLTINEKTGDIYVTGQYADSTIDFDPGPGVAKMVPEIFSMAGTFGQSIYILKLNSQGEFQWVKQITTYNPGTIVSGVVDPSQGESGKIYFTGFVSAGYNTETQRAYPVDFDPNSGTAFLTPSDAYNGKFGFVLSLSGDGEYRSAFKVGSDEFALTSADAITQDKEGNLYVSGTFHGTTDVDPSPATHNITSPSFIGALDMFIIKYNASGAFQWVKQSEPAKFVIDGIERSAELRLKSMDVDTSGGLYLTADLNGPINFDRSIAYGDKATLLSAAHSTATFSRFPATAIVKYSSISGEFEWVKQIGGYDTANRVRFPVSAITKEGNIFVSGLYYNTVDFDPGADSFMLTDKEGAYIAKYDSKGSFLWGGKLAEGSGNAKVLNVNIKAGDTGNVYILGDYVFGSMDFDPTPATFTLTPLANDISNVFMVKLNIASIDTTSPPDTSTYINDREFSASIKAYPNPTMGLLDIASDRSFNNGVMVITNIAGQVVFQRTHLQGARFSFDLKELASGTYFLEIREGTKKNTYKLVKQ